MLVDAVPRHGDPGKHENKLKIESTNESAENAALRVLSEGGEHPSAEQTQNAAAAV